MFFLCPAAVGGAPSDCGVDLRHGGEGQPARQRRSFQQRLPVVLPAHLRQAAVPGRLFRPWHRRHRRAEEGERAAASLSGTRLLLSSLSTHTDCLSRPHTPLRVLSWQDGVKAAKRSIQMEIQTAVHKIYQQLSVTLERALQANKHHIGNTASPRVI